jgi:hypothetical protein
MLDESTVLRSIRHHNRNLRRHTESAFSAHIDVLVADFKRPEEQGINAISF